MRQEHELAVTRADRNPTGETIPKGNSELFANSFLGNLAEDDYDLGAGGFNDARKPTRRTFIDS